MLYFETNESIILTKILQDIKYFYNKKFEFLKGFGKIFN